MDMDFPFGFIGDVINGLRIAAPFIPVLLFIAASIIFWDAWKDYAQAKFADKNPKILLEVKLPQQILKTPLAMELFLTSLYITSRESTWIDRNIKGQSRPTFALELVSLGGEIHFFIWTEQGFKDIVESQIYAQYPDVEVSEIVDYTKAITFIPGQNDLFGVEFVKNNASPIPIKTYIDYGLDKQQEEENKIDPITPLLEFLGSLRPGEQVWIQIVMRAHKKEKTVSVKDKKTGKVTRKKVDWADEAQKEKQKILDSLASDKEKFPRIATKGEADKLAAIDRSISKLPFDTGIRAIYFGETPTALRGVGRGGLMGSIRQFNSNTMNSFGPNNTTSYDYPWQDFRGMRVNKDKKKMLDLYKQRAFFSLWKRKTFVMNTEEIATIYHFPGLVATTPNLPRIMSKRSNPPSNLPI
jgi:hypothetical protein